MLFHQLFYSSPIGIMKRGPKHSNCITKPAPCSVDSSDANTPLFFFSPREAYGEFCQWYPSKFTVSKKDLSNLIGHSIDDSDPDGWQPIYFNCAEQFMM
jgi:hypothetical protein